MKFQYLYILLIAVCFSKQANAQQDPNYTFYRFNMNLINPAYAGASDKTSIGMNLRSQWSSIEGAPETQSFFFGTGVGKNLGVGISIISDKTFIETQTSLAADFSYKLKLDETNDLYFGLKAGFNSYNANTASLVVNQIQSDASLTNLEGSFNPNIGAGVYLKNEKYFVAFSIPKLLSSKRLENYNGTARLNNEKTHVYLASGYNIPINSSFSFNPTLLVRYVNASPLSIDFNPLISYKKLFDFGPTYRVNEGIGAFFIVKGIQWLEIGYAYEATLAKAVSTFDNGSHEIMFNIKLN